MLKLNNLKSCSLNKFKLPSNTLKCYSTNLNNDTLVNTNNNDKSQSDS